MSQELATMPVFPLPLVACPGEIIPLHIFEPRYRAMIQSCRDQQARGEKGEFAIFLEQDGATCPIGCTLRINQILEEHADGRIDLVSTGRQRVRLVERFQKHAYDTAQVETVGDETPDWDEALATQAFEMHRELIDLVTGDTPDETAYSGKHCLSFFLAPSAGMMLMQKQGLLELRSENARLEMLIRHCRKVINRIKNAREMAISVSRAWETQRAFGK